MADLLAFGQDIYRSYWNLSSGSRYIIGGVVLATGLKLCGKHLVIFLLRVTKPLRCKKKPNEYKDDLVYIHIFPRRLALHTPNLSPYAVKLETWLRLKKIQHQVVETVQMSKSTKQIPYIVYNGTEYADSNLIIEFLTKEKNLTDTEALDAEQKAIARGLCAMMDDTFSWSYLLFRYVYKSKDFFKTILRLSESWMMRKMIESFFPKMILERAKYHGIGRKDPETVITIGLNDVQAVSDFLGDKQFMMGDDMTTVDCCMFGHLSQVVYVDFPFPHKSYIQNNCNNLLPYLERIKTKLWPDWNTIVKMSHT